MGIARIFHTLGHYVAHFIVLDGSQVAKLAVEGVFDAKSRTARTFGINARDRPPIPQADRIGELALAKIGMTLIGRVGRYPI